MPGVIALQANAFTTADAAVTEMQELNARLQHKNLADVAMIVICDDAQFVSATINNFLWVTFTRSNPSHDIYGVQEFVNNKHWGCQGPLIIDARIKPHHAPPVLKDKATEQKIDKYFKKGGLLEKWG